MTDFTTRAATPELMDGPCSYEEFRDCLKDLERVNIRTLAYRPTLQWLARLGRGPLSILDAGSGHGDMLRRIRRWADRRKITVALTGVDLNPYAARAASEVAPAGTIAWKTADAFAYTAADGVDVIISSLFTHHLTDPQIVQFLRWMEATALRGWFVNDLHRHPLPYHVFRLWSKLARWHRFVQSDGPISITRSFTLSDWKRLCREAGLPMDRVEIRWRVPFRITVGRIKP